MTGETLPSGEQEPRRTLAKDEYMKAAGEAPLPTKRKSWRILQEIAADKFGFQQGSRKHPNGARLQDVPVEFATLPTPVEVNWYDRTLDAHVPQPFYDLKQVDDLYVDSLEKFVGLLEEALAQNGKHGVDRVVPIVGIGITDKIIDVWRTISSYMPPTA